MWVEVCNLQALSIKEKAHTSLPFTLESEDERASLAAQMIKNLPAIQKTQVCSIGQEEPLEKGMAIHSSILAWRIPWTEEPDGPQSRGCKVRHYQATNTFTFHFEFESGDETTFRTKAILSRFQIHHLRLGPWHSQVSQHPGLLRWKNEKDIISTMFKPLHFGISIVIE